jgi:predicted Zn-ribbon and HTH transcriptional regulator
VAHVQEEEAPGAMTKGVLNALMRNKNRTVCKKCGFPLPVYPGRYPSKCPGCGDEYKKDAEK